LIKYFFNDILLIIHYLSIQGSNMARSQTPLSLEYILLGFLYQGPIHGYDLYKKLSTLEGISLIWHIKQSQLYALLVKLGEAGLLTSRLVPGDGHLMRNEYHITPDGRKTFIKWATSPVSRIREMRQEFLAKLYFAQKLGAAASLQLIGGQKSACTEWISNLHSSYASTAEEKVYERMIFQFRISQTKAALDWLDDCQANIQRISFNHSSNDLSQSS
jgi:PadR family transcriptional regulator, regulatory protein AphA